VPATRAVKELGAHLRDVKPTGGKEMVVSWQVEEKE